ncbi:MAG: hypothetical protein EXS18_00485 [Verrucomicrobiae bacterium]|nr:hypothetical protein [Verrucomicrobiae bacterium]
MKRFLQIAPLFACVTSFVLVIGCSTTESRLTRQQSDAIEARLRDENPPDQLRPLYRALYTQGERNYVLNAMNLAGVAIRFGYYTDAGRVLDEAITRIGGISTGPQAAAARSTFKEEAVKPFKGEPYERVMVYFYRGLLYFRDAEYDNARACFRSAALEDSSSVGEQYQADFASLDYLMALCSQKLHTPDVDDALKRAREELRGGGTLPSTDPGDNLLVFVGVGRGPFKYAAGQYGELLRFHEQFTPEVKARVYVDGQWLGDALMMDNLYFQATTRGGRVIDHVLAGKAVFKQTTGTIGNVGLAAGAGLAVAGANSRGSSRDNLLIAGAAAAAVGIIGKVLESNARPEADTRQWDSLPLTIQIVSARLAPGPHRVRIEFLDGHGVQVGGLDREMNVTIPADNKEQVVIAHSR